MACVCLHDVFAEEASVLGLQDLGRVPVEDRDKWLQPCGDFPFFRYMSMS